MLSLLQDFKRRNLVDSYSPASTFAEIGPGASGQKRKQLFEGGLYFPGKDALRLVGFLTHYFYKVMTPDFMFRFNAQHPARMCSAALQKSPTTQRLFRACCPDPQLLENVDLATSPCSYGILYRWLFQSLHQGQV